VGTDIAEHGIKDFNHRAKSNEDRNFMAAIETDDFQKHIQAELRAVKRLLALSIADGKKQTDQIRLLATAGLDRHEIADLLGTTPLTVSVVSSNLRKKGAIRAKKG
jgi:CRP-like cAMP-binding protein